MTSIFLNVYENTYSHEINQYKTIEQWFELTKHSPYSESITAARKFKKGDSIYEAIKKIIPTITYNFLFKNKKSNDNIIDSTGYLYIDVDDLSFDINSLDTNKILAYYKSFGGLGYSIIVKVDGLTLNNYNSTYLAICKELGLEYLFDKGAKKATQHNVLSYDPNIFINYNSKVFSAVNEIENVLRVNVTSKKEEAYTYTLSTKYNGKIRYNNLDEIEIADKYVVNWKGYKYVKCWLPFVKMATDRNNYLLSYTTNFVWLNPQLNEKAVFKVISNVNNNVFHQPVNAKHIARVIKSVFTYKANNTLKPIYFRKNRKLVFADDCRLNKIQKLEICRKEFAIKCKGESEAKILSIIENWNFIIDGKITIRNIVKVGKMGNNTVTKYWNKFKELVDGLNSEYKEELTPVTKQKTKKTQNIMETQKQPQTALNTVITNDAPLVHVKPRIETGTYNIIDDFDVVMEGINIWNNLIADLTFDEKMDAETEIVKTLIEKPVSNYELKVAGKTVKVFSNATIEPNFIQVTLIEEEAIISPVMKDNNILDEVIIEQEIIEQEYCDECLEDIFTAEEIIQLEAMFKNN